MVDWLSHSLAMFYHIDSKHGFNAWLIMQKSCRDAVIGLFLIKKKRTLIYDHVMYMYSNSLNSN